MHIFIFRKRFLLFFFCILCLILLILFSFSIHDSPILAVSLNSNSAISENLQNTFNNLSNNTDKIAYLTFDDGPRKKCTPEVLDILKEENVKATFFVVGKYVKENPGKAAVVVPVSAAAAILAPVPGATELAFIGSSKGYDLAKKGINKAFRKNNKKYKK